MKCPNCGVTDFRLEAQCDQLFDLDKDGKITGITERDLTSDQWPNYIQDPEMQAYCTACGRTYPVDFDNEDKVQITGPCFEDEEEE